MRATISFLDRVEVAAPCSAPWEEMTGDDRTRFCDKCRKNVYNLSDMSRHEAEELVRQAGDDSICIQFYRRTDGTVMTDNCPVGLRKLRDAVVRKWAVAASVVAALVSLFGRQASANVAPKPKRDLLIGGRMVAVLNRTYTGRSIRTKTDPKKHKAAQVLPTSTRRNPK